MAKEIFGTMRLFLLLICLSKISNASDYDYDNLETPEEGVDDVQAETRELKTRFLEDFGDKFVDDRHEFRRPFPPMDCDPFPPYGIDYTTREQSCRMRNIENSGTLMDGSGIDGLSCLTGTVYRMGLPYIKWTCHVKDDPQEKEYYLNADIMKSDEVNLFFIDNVHIQFNCQKGISYMFIFVNITTYKDATNVNCRASALEIIGSHIDIVDLNLYSLNSSNSTIKEIDTPGNLNVLKIQTTTIERMGSLQVLENGNETNFIRNSNITKVHDLTVAGKFTFSNTTIDTFDHVSMSLTGKSFLTELAIKNVKSHGILGGGGQLKILNTTFENLEKYAINSYGDNELLLLNVTILNCTAPCILYTGGQLKVKDVFINGESADHHMEKYARHVRSDLALDVLRKELSSQDKECRKDGEALVCDGINSNGQVFDFIHTSEDSNRWANFSNFEGLDIFYDCGKHFSLVNVTGTIFPQDTLSKQHCQEDVIFELINSTIHHTQVKTPVIILGKGNRLLTVYASAPLNLQLKDTTIGKLKNAEIATDQQWQDLFIREVHGLKIDANLTIGPQTSIMTVKDLVVRKSMTLLESTIGNLNSAKVQERGILVLNRSLLLVVDDKGIYLDEKASFICEGSSLPGTYRGGYISVASYEQVQGACKSYMYSQSWIADVAKIRAPEIIDNPIDKYTVTPRDQRFCGEKLLNNQSIIDCDYSSIENENVVMDGTTNTGTRKGYEITYRNVNYLSVYVEKLLRTDSTKLITQLIKALTSGLAKKNLFPKISITADKRISIHVDNVKQLHIQPNHSHPLESLSISNTHSDQLVASMGHFNATNSTIGYFHSVSLSTITMKISNSKISTAVIENSGDALFENTTVEILQKMSMEGNITFINCHIEGIRTYATKLEISDTLLFENVTIGFLETEAMVIRGNLIMRNVTIESMSDSAILFDQKMGTVNLSDVTVKQAEGRPFVDMRRDLISIRNVTINKQMVVSQEIIGIVTNASHTASSVTFPAKRYVQAQEMSFSALVVIVVVVVASLLAMLMIAGFFWKRRRTQGDTIPIVNDFNREMDIQNDQVNMETLERAQI